MRQILAELWRGVVVAELRTDDGQAFYLGIALMTVLHYLDEPYCVLMVAPFALIAGVRHMVNMKSDTP